MRRKYRAPITHGVNGFLSDDSAEPNAYARQLLADRELAHEMGHAAQRTVAKAFSEQAFRSNRHRTAKMAGSHEPIQRANLRV